MFGLLQPSRCRLGPELHEQWTAHLCGTCLAAGREFGQLARTTTNVDALLASVLVAAQQPGPVPQQRAARCPLRGMRPAQVVAPDGAGARYAAAVSVLLAGQRVADHVADGDLPGAVRPAARRVATRWTGAGAALIAEAGLDTASATSLVDRQAAAEADAGPGDLLAVTAPIEDVTAEVLAGTATIAGRPGNAEPLAEIGRMFGRVAHLLDAVGDLAHDRRRGTWNPLVATGTDLAQARGLVDGAVQRVRAALDRLELSEPDLVRHLLGRELPHRVARVFASAGEPWGPPPPAWGPPPHQLPHHGRRGWCRRRCDDCCDCCSRGDCCSCGDCDCCCCGDGCCCDCS